MIILGGADKGADFSVLASAVAESNVRQAILTGNTRNKIKAALDEVGYSAYKLFDEKSTMTQIIDAAQSSAKAGDVVIMSPACSSFDMFKNYKDRGDQFVTAVTGL